MGLLKCQGKTPEATMASALYTDVKRKLHKSLFTRPQEGLFGLREWLDEGYYPEGWVGPPDGLGLAPFKRRNAVAGGGTSPSGTKPGRSGARTGPGRSSKSKASRSWRNAASDAEDDEDVPLDDDDEDDEDALLTGRSGLSGSAAAALGAGGGGSGDEEALGEGEEADEEVEDAEDEGAGGLEEHGREERGSGEAGQEAACVKETGSMGGASEMLGGPPSKRKRPTSISVPDSAGAGAITPKSPYEDSLAALHEIATSPSTFELTSARERDREAISGGGARGASEGGSGAKASRNRPRLHVDVPGNGMELGTGPGSRRDGTPGTTLLTDNPMLQGETTPAILLQASPVTTANGQQAMMLRQAPVLVTLPPALVSPSAGGQLDTPALLHVQLPGGAPSELMQTALITSSGQQAPLTPFRTQAAAARGGLLKVGKAWLALARMYQHLGESERNNGTCCKSSMAMAAEALKRAMAVCRACAESCGTEVQCEEAYRYLTTRNSEAALAQPVKAQLDGDVVMQQAGQAAEGADTPAQGAAQDVAMADAAAEGVPAESGANGGWHAQAPGDAAPFHVTVTVGASGLTDHGLGGQHQANPTEMWGPPVAAE
ncbi:hypothetical protein GPECTOR_38g318 [Gonium pectorale]|uniref:HTH HARE-type domain-containing protein n=1 Tax=Gonium pectorale TaxID=33097 RepID=A0A150GB56_GONPE|nr:hypothetical protein GPECTOR_38g318 [Gonium pectorale]|eukprot:KXZ47081.1 hypothetical protein GPECTOR_38g318 [Gonium pectorale]